MDKSVGYNAHMNFLQINNQEPLSHKNEKN